jgi:hypothetical protein
MKTKIVKPNTSLVPQPRSFRRFVRNMFASFLKRQGGGYGGGFQKEVLRRLKGIEDRIAREMMPRAKRSK